MVLMLPRQMPTVPVMAPLRAMPRLVQESVFDFLAKDDGGNSHAHRKNRKAEKQEGDNAEDQSGGVPMMMRFRGLLWKRGLLHETFLHSTSFQLPIS